MHLLLAGEVHQRGDRVVVHALGGAGTVVLTWDGPVTCAALEVRELDDPLLTEVWGDRLTRLVLRLDAVPTGTLTTTVEEAR
ncbi:hypothetical protein [Cellulomonas sp. ATA003]|uniref:hypothetical protein n=1 Tax=Cellulomonas sp. ATA003 TaxID=3073064 RepID=UPI00287314BC|nr:hypothetical protein [Cellulomonas sp. ATA003]WNB87662.1 hypothetical protein REH70_02700 [Cellulomonas sp. ATA003]